MICPHLYLPLLSHQEALHAVCLVVAHQGVLEVAHCVQGSGLNQECARMEGTIELDQDNGNILIKITRINLVF